MSKSKLWTKDFIIVSTINFFLTLVFYLLIVIMGVYAVNEFNASTSQAGLVTGIFIIGALIGRLFIGRSIEMIGRKRTLFIGLISRPFTGRLMDLKGANYIMYPAFILFTAGMLLLSSAHSSITLLVSGILIGLGFGNMQSCTQAIAIKLTP